MSMPRIGVARRLHSLKLASVLLAIVASTGGADSTAGPAPYNRAVATVGVIHADALTARLPPRNVGLRDGSVLEVAGADHRPLEPDDYRAAITPP